VRWYALILLLAGVALTGCSSPANPPAAGPEATAGVIAVRLPKGAFPRFLTVAADGSVWCGESSGESLAHIGRDGSVNHVRIPGSSNSPADIVQTPDGVIWFTGFEMIGKIGTDGRLSGWRTKLTGTPQIGLPNALTLGPDQALWYTNKKSPPTITRIAPPGQFTDFPIASPDETSRQLGAITTGPDNALWFTEADQTSGDAIGRITLDGHYTRRPLGTSDAGPNRITTGPDGALWFTTMAGQIGRITVNGVISTFPLPNGTVPFDIARGKDGALWFTTDQHSLGRITTSGQLTLHPIDGANRLIGITAAPDGTFWLADGPGDTVWHVTPQHT
jgi:virginiamycin B lyase